MMTRPFPLADGETSILHAKGQKQNENISPLPLLREDSFKSPVLTKQGRSSNNILFI